MNTKIEYFHRDEFNNKTYYEAILEGSMTDEQEEEILNCIDEEGAFIPVFLRPQWRLRLRLERLQHLQSACDELYDCRRFHP